MKRTRHVRYRDDNLRIIIAASDLQAFRVFSQHPKKNP